MRAWLFGCWLSCAAESPSVAPEVLSRPDSGVRFGGEPDLDGDGWVAEDCRPEDPAYHPGVPEWAYDGEDQDCDAFDLTDVDGDGSDWRTDCNDLDPSRSVQDADGDTWPSCWGDCDEDPSRYPFAPLICGDGIDNDCDGYSDCGQYGYRRLPEGTTAHYPTSSVVMSTWGDLDGDGEREWIFAGYSPLVGYPVKLRGEAWFHQSTFELEGIGSFLRAVDVDGDGRDELLHDLDMTVGYTRMHDDFEVRPRQNRYEAVWRGGQSGVGVSDDTSPVTADLDGDGFLEVSTIEVNPTFYSLIPPLYPEVKYSLLFNTEPSWLSAPHYLVLDSRLVDFTGDGAVDLMLTRDLDGRYGTEHGSHGFLVPGPIHPGLTPEGGVELPLNHLNTTGDIDGDGYQDMLGSQSDTFQVTVAFLGPFDGVDHGWQFRLGSEPGGSVTFLGSQWMTLGDLDGDGQVDLAYRLAPASEPESGGVNLDYRLEYFRGVEARTAGLVIYGPLEGTLDPFHHPRMLVLLPNPEVDQYLDAKLVPDVDGDGRDELVVNQSRLLGTSGEGLLGMYWLRGGVEGW